MLPRVLKILHIISACRHLPISPHHPQFRLFMAAEEKTLLCSGQWAGSWCHPQGQKPVGQIQLLGLGGWSGSFLPLMASPLLLWWWWLFKRVGENRSNCGDKIGGLPCGACHWMDKPPGLPLLLHYCGRAGLAWQSIVLGYDRHSFK